MSISSGYWNVRFECFVKYMFWAVFEVSLCLLNESQHQLVDRLQSSLVCEHILTVSGDIFIVLFLLTQNWYNYNIKKLRFFSKFASINCYKVLFGSRRTQAKRISRSLSSSPNRVSKIIAKIQKVKVNYILCRRSWNCTIIGSKCKGLG